MFCENVIVEYRDRPKGSESKLNTFTDGFKVIKTIIKLFKNYKPFSFFSIIALALLILSLVFFIPVLVNYLKIGIVDKIPTVIVCGITFVIAIISFFSGLILDTIKQKNRQDFELELHKASNRYKDLIKENNIINGNINE